ncbi:MAG: hypothetical protein ACREBV_07500 [Candidatus Zixiibacteriota bacterium]
MEIHIGVEDIEPKNWVAWVFEFPGCYARASTREEAIKLAPQAVEELLKRMGPNHTPFDDTRPLFEFRVVEEFRSVRIASDYLINAFFENDRIPVSRENVEYARRLLNMNRDELKLVLSMLTEVSLSRQITGEVRGNIKGILKHVGTTEWWYWDRLGMAFPREQLPNDLFELLERVRDFTNENLAALIENKMTTTKRDEIWSPRKLLRRTIWHERVHTLQIARYVKNF